MTVLLWIVTIGLGLFLLSASFGKLRGTRMLVETMERLGVSTGMTKLIGLLELAAVVGIVLGAASDSMAGSGIAASIGVIVLMILAMGYHRRAGDPAVALAGPIVVLLLSVLYLIFVIAN